MISIIISSANPDLLKNVTQNIKNTVGVPYEIVSFDNSKGESGLCKLYNEGIRKAKFEYLCFMHEDVDIKTFDWGKIVIDHFNKDSQLGLVGLAGSKYKSTIPLGWDSLHLSSNYINIIQEFKNKEKHSTHEYYNPENKSLIEVVCIDGVWFCSPKNIAKEFLFDEKGLPGFHGYDIDFSLAVGQKYKVAVTSKVLLTHFSEGQYSLDWFKDIYYIHKKWRNLLPLNLNGIKGKELLKVEEISFKYILKTYHEHLSIKEAFDILNASSIRSLSLIKYIRLSYKILRTYYHARKEASA